MSFKVFEARLKYPSSCSWKKLNIVKSLLKVLTESILKSLWQLRSLINTQKWDSETKFNILTLLTDLSSRRSWLWSWWWLCVQARSRAQQNYATYLKVDSPPGKNVFSPVCVRARVCVLPRQLEQVKNRTFILFYVILSDLESTQFGTYKQLLEMRFDPEVNETIAGIDMFRRRGLHILEYKQKELEEVWTGCFLLSSPSILLY